MRKHLTGATRQFYAKDSKGNDVKVGSEYSVAEAIPQLPAGGVVDFHRELDFGLSLGKATLQTNDNGPDLVAPPFVSLRYSPVVTQQLQPTEHYHWTELLRGIDASADLPRTITIQYPAWTIEDLIADYHQPLLISNLDSGGTETNRTYSGNDRGSDDKVSLRYEWSDGLVADASVTTHLHQAPVDNWTLLGIASEVLDGESYVQTSFSPGTDDDPDSGDQYWSLIGNLNPQGVVVQPAGVNWIQAESAAAAGFAALELFVPESFVVDAAYVGFGSAILGESTNFTSPPAAHVEPWAYGGPNGLAGTPDQCDAVIAFWNAQGRVRQPDYIADLPQQPGNRPCLFARWHIVGQPPTITQYYLGDKWGSDGYEGQTIRDQIDDSRTVFKDSPLHGNLLYEFDFPVLHDDSPGHTGPPPHNPPGGGGGQ